MFNKFLLDGMSIDFKCDARNMKYCDIYKYISELFEIILLICKFFFIKYVYNIFFQ